MPLRKILFILLIGLVSVSCSSESDSDSEQSSNKPSATVISSQGKGVKIQSWKSSKGAKVMFVNAPQLPMIDIRLVLLFLLLLAAIISYHAWCLMSDEYAASTIFEHNSLIVRPAFAAAFGKSECVVKPGIVLTSRA